MPPQLADRLLVNLSEFLVATKTEAIGGLAVQIQL
jgi:hypothetical protein